MKKNKVQSLLIGVVSIDKNTKRFFIIFSDVFFIFLSVWLAFSIRFGDFYEPNIWQMYSAALLALICSVTLFFFGAYRAVIRYFGGRSIIKIAYAILVSSILWSGITFLLKGGGVDGLPRAIPIIFIAFANFFLIGSRLFISSVINSQMHPSTSRRSILIYGSESAGRQLAASLQHSSEFDVVGFIDDRSRLLGSDIGGFRIYHSTDVPSLVDRFDVKEIILSSPNISSSERATIVSFIERLKLRMRVLPGIADTTSGSHVLNMVRELDIGDLLGRAAVEPDIVLLKKAISGRVVLVTGAGGSIGSELCRQVANLGPSHLIMLDSSEPALYQIDRELRVHDGKKLTPVLQNICDYRDIKNLIIEYQVDTIYHAAAYKHVPLVECNIKQGIRNNILGTETILSAAYDIAIESRVSKLAFGGPKNIIMISSDKAVRPTNIMGATKRWSELLLEFYSGLASKNRTGQIYSAVRFGNVLGSSGSVVPLFKEQILAGGPVTLTHPEVTRYFMSIHEAVGLVIQAGSMSEGGEIFLLDMGMPVKIYDLAKSMISLFGRSGDIDIVTTGLRPGEKLYEELLVSEENAQPTMHPRIMKAVEIYEGNSEIKDLLAEIKALSLSGSNEAIRDLLMKVANQ